MVVMVSCVGGYLDGWYCTHDNGSTWDCSVEMIIVPDDGKAPTGGLGIDPTIVSPGDEGAAPIGGGPIVGGDPSWPPAANLTPGPGGLGGWTFLQFVTALREGKRPDGTALRAPMVNMMPYAQKMTNVELEALWTYVKSVPAVAPRH